MKTLLLAAGLLALAFAAEAQVTGSLLLGTNTVPVLATNTTASSGVLDVVRQPQVGLYVSAATSSSTNATTFVLAFSVSPNGTTYYALPQFRIPVVLNGTNVVTTFSNVDATGFRYLKVATYENVSALNPSNAVSSIAVTYFLK